MYSTASRNSNVGRACRLSCTLFICLNNSSDSSTLLTTLDAFQHFQRHFLHDQEEVYVVALNASQKIIETRLLFRGTVDFCLFHPRDILRFVITVNAVSFIIAHNHPSGDPTPSYADLVLTKKLHQASRLVQIELLDHLILTREKYVSLKEWGAIKTKKRYS
jgi:DNA repair protein RadC